LGETNSVVSDRQIESSLRHKNPQNRILTFESWVTRPEWFRYAIAHPDEVPHLLSDRSPCQDPFFDLFASEPSQRRPTITGLCRCLKNFNVGDRYIYVTKLCSGAERYLGLAPTRRARYLGVASMFVVDIMSSHEEAARLFEPRRYVVSPLRTPYSPGLAHDLMPVAAVARESCIIHAPIAGDEAVDPIAYGARTPLTPIDSTSSQWLNDYLAYHRRENSNKLRVALCRFDTVAGREAVAMNPKDAVVLTAEDWGGLQLNVMGRRLSNAAVASLCERIASRGHVVRPLTSELFSREAARRTLESTEW
jgi:hypothetical protein